MSWWVPLVAILGLIVIGVLVVIFAPVPRKESRMGQHSFLGDRDVDDSGGDVELLAVVTGLGETRDYDREAWTASLDLSTGGWDLRGVRDRDQDAPHPWRGT